MSARAIVEVVETITVRIEWRPPKKGELGFPIPLDVDEEEALRMVVDCRDKWNEGDCGYGIRVRHRDWPEFDQYDEDEEFSRVRNITVIVEHVRTTPGAFRLL